MNIINVVHYLHLHVIHLSELFTYPNTFLRPVATGIRISEDALHYLKHLLYCSVLEFYP